MYTRCIGYKVYYMNFIHMTIHIHAKILLLYLLFSLLTNIKIFNYYKRPFNRYILQINLLHYFTYTYRH